jgi:hypothetical protein
MSRATDTLDTVTEAAARNLRVTKRALTHSTVLVGLALLAQLCQAQAVALFTFVAAVALLIDGALDVRSVSARRDADMTAGSRCGDLSPLASRLILWCEPGAAIDMPPAASIPATLPANSCRTLGIVASDRIAAANSHHALPVSHPQSTCAGGPES